MQAILRWTWSQEHPGADVRLARFMRVLHAAQRTNAYQPFLLESAGLATLEALSVGLGRTDARAPSGHRSGNFAAHL